MKYFEGIQTLQELKSAYKKLAMVFHPDRGGDLETMKTINNEYDQLFNILKDGYNATQSEERQMPVPQIKAWKRQWKIELIEKLQTSD